MTFHPPGAILDPPRAVEFAFTDEVTGEPLDLGATVQELGDNLHSRRHSAKRAPGPVRREVERKVRAARADARQERPW